MARTIASAAAALMAFSLAVPAHAQDEPPATEGAGQAQEPDEETVIRGRRSLFALRKDVEAAREHVWEVFNEINSDDDFDISCNDSARTGTRMTRRACRPQYANEATAQRSRMIVPEKG